MKRITYILITIFLLSILGCKSAVNSENNAKERMRLEFRVIHEDDKRNLYYVEWKDTLGVGVGYHEDLLKWLKRPKETWCIITNANSDTLGYYYGLSTAQSFANFQSTDSVINLNFMIGLNFFSDLFENKVTLFEHQKAAQEYIEEQSLPLEFKPLTINVNKDQNRWIEIELEENNYRQ